MKVFPIFAATIIICAVSLSRASEKTSDTISSVIIEGNRVDESLIRSRITLREGIGYTAEEAEKSKKKLYEMNLFREVSISTETAAGGTEVRIRAVDGWYLLPLPFYRGGSGGSSLSLMLLERNFFRRAESFYFLKMSNDESDAYMTGFSAYGLSVNVSPYQRRSYTERIYAGGAVNVTGLSRSSADGDDLRRLGPVAEEHQKRTRTENISVGFKTGRFLRLEIFAEKNRVSYPSGSAATSGDAGKQNFIELRLSPGRSRGPGMMAEAFGSIFGLGLADVGERIKRINRHRFSIAPEAAFLKGGSFAGSDYAFSRITAGLSGRLELPGRHSAGIRIRSMSGRELPFSQMVATGQDLALSGNYGLEYRGSRGIGASGSYTHMISKSGRGILIASAFAEMAGVSGSAYSGCQSGAGGSIGYMFWRFPMPIGFAYTYSFKNEISAFNFTLGGRF